MGGAGEGKRSDGNDVNTALMLQTLKTLKIKFKNSLPRTLPFPHFNDSNRNFKVRACKSVSYLFFKWERERPVEVTSFYKQRHQKYPLSLPGGGLLGGN